MRDSPLRTSFVIRATALCAVACLSFLVALESSVSATRAEIETDVPEISSLPDPPTVAALSLGYRTFVADLIWLVAIQRHDKRTERDTLVRYIDAILHLDPDFRRAYVWAGNTIVLAGGATSPENCEAANRVLALAMERYPDDAYFPYTMALNYSFYYPAKTVAEKRRVQREAIELLQVAMQRQGAPRGIVLLIAGLIRSTSGSSEAVNDFLEQAYVAERDPEVRAQIEDRMANLGADRQRLFERRREARETWIEAQGVGYLPPGLAFQLGSRVDEFEISAVP